MVIEDDNVVNSNENFNTFTLVSNKLEYQQVKEKFALKHVDINVIEMNKENEITVDPSSTG